MLAQGLILLFALAGEAPPPAAPAATPVPARQRSLADVARENRERKERRDGTLSVAGAELPPEAQATPAFPSPPKGRRVPGVQSPGANALTGSGPAGTSNALDRGSDESYWRDKSQRLRSELDVAHAAYAAENERARKLLTQAKTTEEANRLGEELKKTKLPCRLRVESAQRQLDALPEEAHRAGANPGWVR